MTMAIAFQTDRRRFLIAIQIPTIRLSVFRLLILALLLPTVSLFLVEGIAQAGYMSLAATITGLGLTLALLGLEVRQNASTQ